MKKLFSKLMFLALAAVTFTACEDVPNPYDVPGTGSNVPGAIEIPGGVGEGTFETPFNAIAALNFGKKLETGQVSKDYMYIKGKVSKIESAFESNSYGNGTFYISNDGGHGNEFYVYRVNYLGNKKYAKSDTPVKLGDDVIICAKITNYNGTIETNQGEGFVYELNGENRGGEILPSEDQGDNQGEAAGDGTQANPYNVAGVLAFINTLGDKTSDNVVYVKGKISKVEEEFGTQYGNATFNISDEGTSNWFKAYQVYHLGNKKYTGTETQIKLGDEVIVCGKVVNFKGNTPETAARTGYIYSLNGVTESSDTPDTPVVGGEGDGTKDSPYNVTAAIAAASKTGAYVKGYIVGNAPDKTISSAIFTADGASETNILIAASADETQTANCMAVQLPTGDIRTKLNLSANPSNLKKEVILYGNIENYFGQVGIKSVTYAILEGTEIGNNPGGGSTPEPSGDTALNVDFKAGIGNWTIDDKNKPAEISAIWVHDAKYGMKATAYVNSTKQNYDSESWLVSPAIDLSNYTTATLKVHHAINFFASVDKAKEEATVMARIGSGQWEEVPLSNWPSSLSWTFVDATADMSAFAGESNVQIAFRYTSTAAKAGTWEVEKVSIE